MKILFIYPDMWTYGGGFHYGIAYISAVLKMSGYEISLLHIRKEVAKKELINEVGQIKPDLIAFSSTTNQFPYVKIYARWIKESFNLPIICGGVHATFCPDEVISCNHIDIACIGEGEYPLLELVDALRIGKQFDKTQNLWVKNGERVIRNSLRPLISDLDSLPFPDRKIFQYEAILKRRGGEGDILAGRGCPFGCTYCCNHAMRKIYAGKGRYVRMRSSRNVLNEIKDLKNDYGSQLKAINFDDDTFTLFHKWVKEFCEAYETEFDYPFSCNVRVETVNREILATLKKAGCDTIKIGVESGSEWLRKNVLKRSMTNEQIIAVCKTAHELGLKIYVFNMIGLPFETPSMIEETITLNRIIAPNRMQFSIFYPYPNNELYEICAREGFLTGKHKTSYFDEGTSLNLPTLTDAQINEYYLKFRDLAAEAYIKTYHPKLAFSYRISKCALGSKATSLFYWFKKKL